MIEMLVAVFVFTMSVTAFVLVASRGVFTVRHATQQVVAQHLAQEGIELFRAKRDHNFLEGNPWTAGLTQCSGTFGCSVDTKYTITESFPACSSESCTILYLEDADSDGQYERYVDENHQAPDMIESVYRRQVVLNSLGTDVSEIISTVTWEAGSRDRNVELRTVITNWKP